jgi:GT2 family glycosyltransferase
VDHRPSVAGDNLPQICRPEARGKFLYSGDQKLYVKGVTYGPFRRDEQGSEYGSPEQVSSDFAAMAADGINAVRTYTPPPRWLLDYAQAHGLRVMVGLPWEQHIAFLDDPGRTKDVEERVRQAVRGCAGHPAVLAYSVGNEIPAPIVRWHGARRIERFLHRLYLSVKAEDPGALITYVNYPTTEYLQLPFLDFVSFNVYLEAEDRLAAYLARLQNLAGDRPLVLAEIGLDSRRNGEEGQARALDWQVRTAFSAGCAGAFVFAWTDEWHRGGFDIEDWDFGLTDRERRPKPALTTIRRTYEETPLQADLTWPRVSVIVCSYNGSRTMRDCCEGLCKLDYPDYEVIVVDDGSTDGVGEIAASHGFRVIRTENKGLSSARNTGWQAATGEIVAYIDDDAWPDPHWLRYLAATFLSSDVVGVGGPNLPPPGDGPIAQAVARAPGGPTHVLLSDQIAEHIPGCNMAFRRDALRDLGGFDPQFRAAGDDVDLCWRLQARGWRLGFSPAALVWHHRRNSIRAYWRQQRNYGKAEALLEMKWPEKYNPVGHVTWEGRLYGNGLTRALMWRSQRIYHGVWGTGLFQSLYDRRPGLLNSLPLMPEWYLVIAGLAALSFLGLLWAPLLIAAPLLALACAAVLVQAIDSVTHASSVSQPSGNRPSLKVASLTLLLHLLQPLARLLVLQP